MSMTAITLQQAIELLARTDLMRREEFSRGSEPYKFDADEDPFLVIDPDDADWTLTFHRNANPSAMFGGGRLVLQSEEEPDNKTTVLLFNQTPVDQDPVIATNHEAYPS